MSTCAREPAGKSFAAWSTVEAGKGKSIAPTGRLRQIGKLEDNVLREEKS